MIFQWYLVCFEILNQLPEYFTLESPLILLRKAENHKVELKRPKFQRAENLLGRKMRLHPFFGHIFSYSQ